MTRLTIKLVEMHVSIIMKAGRFKAATREGNYRREVTDWDKVAKRNSQRKVTRLTINIKKEEMHRSIIVKDGRFKATTREGNYRKEVRD